MLRAELKKLVLATEITVLLCLVAETLLEREECVFSMPSQLSQSWGQFLSQFSWDWFVTLTFRDWVKSFSAHRQFGYFVRDLEKAAGLPIFWFRADEVGPHGGRFHIHALIGNVAHLRRMSWVDKWDELAGWARILQFDAGKGAAFYCAKYVTKQSGDWELSDNLAAFRQYQPVLSLQGQIKPRTVAPALPPKASDPISRNRDKRPQYPLAFMFKGDNSAQGSMISQVYRSEVTRGRGRFREFFPPTFRPGK